MKTLVIGASENVQRYSNMAIRKLLNYDHEVVAIGAKEGEVNNVKINKEQIVFDGIHTITLYVNPQRQEAYFDYVVGLHPKRVIFNPGTENPKFYKLLRDHSIPYEEACTLVLLSTNQY